MFDGDVGKCRVFDRLSENADLMVTGRLIWDVTGVQPLDERFERRLAGIADGDRLWISRSV